jgi:hypothetical protein
MIDVAPTILDLVGVQKEQPMSGRSLLPFVFDKAKERGLDAISLLYQQPVIIRTFRRSGAKLQVTGPVESDGKAYGRRIEYFDLTSDSGEQSPISSGPQVDSIYREYEQAVRREDELRARLGTGSGESISLPRILQSALEQLGYVEDDDANSQ